MEKTQLIRYLILSICIILIYFGFGTLMNLGSHPEVMGMFIFYALAMFVESAILLFCSYRLNKRNKRIFWLAVIILCINVIMVIFDQFGFIDILFMLLNLSALALLYASREEFLPE